ncbi:MAG: 1-deoxy-D-xylulose-5-phosphate synthase [Clostridia bacterium]|nr:1-deoxy-D-xylulose-5-phosphate synthase [Clostridia bacterium]
MKNLLDKINSPEDIKQLKERELQQLSQEIREYIIDTVSETGGHLASNLGVVELSLALHKVFDSPKDKIIWDVGHQAYIHKLLTGRKEKLKTIRTLGGLSGFPKRSESEHDIFETGHSSTSISAALGIAKARDLSGEDYNVIAVIGDGSLTGGMAFEALNHAGDFPTRLIVILNDNNMSISDNIGGMSNYLSKIRTVPAYFKFKARLGGVLKNIPVLGDALFNSAEKLKNWFKYLLVPGIIFEELGFKYLGPIDGHDINNLEYVLNRAKSYNGYPVFIHVITKKGKGYEKAENNPSKYHGVNPFDIKSGKSKSTSQGRSYSNVFGDWITKAAISDKRIAAVTAAMPEGTGLSKFANQHKDRFFDVGIAEQHAVTFSAGLAVGGYKPYFAVYSTFLQRAYDQIIHDVCMQKLPVTFAIDRAGLVGPDGETHHGVFDISYLSHMPNMTIMSPKDGLEMEQMLDLTLQLDSPCAIRYPRGNEDFFDECTTPVALGKSEILLQGSDATIIAEGRMVRTAYKACQLLLEKGISLTLINARFIKPLDEEMLIETAQKQTAIFTLEDGVLSGGMGSGILEFYNKMKIQVDMNIIAYDDLFITHGEIDELQMLKEMHSEGIASRIEKKLRNLQ